MVLSKLPEARVLPSGLKATEWTEEERPERVASSFLVARCQNLMVLSELAEARILPSRFATLATPGSSFNV